MNTGLDELEEEATGNADDFPEPGSIDVALGLHMLYFATGVVRSLGAILRFLKPGSAYFSVVTDETTAFSGSMLRSFIESGGDTGNNDRYSAAIDERRRLLAPVSEGGGGLAEAVRAAGIEVEADAVLQATRMYGHSLAYLRALANISVLTGHTGTRKFESAAKTLGDRPEDVDLRIETGVPERGCGAWSNRNG